MASSAGLRKRPITVSSTLVERVSKRPHIHLSQEDGDESAPTVTDARGTSERIPDTPIQPISATLVRGHGPVWAMGRQDLCEAQSHFRSYQSGLHSNNNIVKGFYISEYSEPRDIIYRNVLIISM